MRAITLEIDLACIVLNMFYERKLGEIINDLIPSEDGTLSSSSWLLTFLKKLLMPYKRSDLVTMEALASFIPVDLLMSDEDANYEMINR